jgi:hypothetical protein
MSYRLLTVALMTAGAVFATQCYAETVKGNKSNSLKQSSGSGGGAGATNEAVKLNTSRSNIYREGKPRGPSGAAARGRNLNTSRSN